MPTNLYQPLIPNPYGYSGQPTYNNADVPSNWATVGDLTPEQLAQRLAYEWLDSHQISGGQSNPPFLSGAAGRLHPLLRENGQAQRILRGYIRRSNFEAGDQLSMTRLYFMYNPETIVRDYVSYLDQAALDPFNTVYQSNNLVAPPSFMNFRFDLFFDRQDEVSQDRNHPGVLVDYQYFDMVVRNVVPTDPNGMNNQIPDNGVMMVNPRDITVVFSPQLTVQGRPINAQVIFEKFSHRMTPIRMRIALELRVTYFGPLRPQTELGTQGFVASTTDTVSPDDLADITVTFQDLVVVDGAADGAQGYVPGADPGVGEVSDALRRALADPNGRARVAALAWAGQHVRQRPDYLNEPWPADGLPPWTDYDANFDLHLGRGYGGGNESVVHPDGWIRTTACSPLILMAYKETGLLQYMRGWTLDGSSWTMFENLQDCEVVYKWGKAGQATYGDREAWEFFSSRANRDLVLPGDILIRYQRYEGGETGHVGWFVEWTSTQDPGPYLSSGPGFTCFEAVGSSKEWKNNPKSSNYRDGKRSGGTQIPVGNRPRSFKDFITRFNAIVRPMPFGSGSVAGLTTNNSYVGTAP